MVSKIYSDSQDQSGVMAKLVTVGDNLAIDANQSCMPHESQSLAYPKLNWWCLLLV